MAGFLKPGKAVRGVMIALLGIWLLFAVAINWGDAGDALFYLFCGNTELILGGEIWRLFTAPLMHAPSGTIGHILFALLGLFFLAPRLEVAWGPGRTLRFLGFSALIAYGTQMLLELALPASIAQKLVGPYWFGFFPVITAIAIAWALTFRGQVVRLFFVFPVTSKGLVAFIVAGSLLMIVAASRAPEGLLAPFGGMLAGWLLGGGTPSPLRRAYLRFRLAQLDREAARRPAGARARGRKRDVPLRVIEGGRGKNDPDDRGPDGRLLN
jgi:membrane associated rhomboid family serine protease